MPRISYYVSDRIADRMFHVLNRTNELFFVATIERHRNGQTYSIEFPDGITEMQAQSTVNVIGMLLMESEPERAPPVYTSSMARSARAATIADLQLRGDENIVEPNLMSQAESINFDSPEIRDLISNFGIKDEESTTDEEFTTEPFDRFAEIAERDEE